MNGIAEDMAEGVYERIAKNIAHGLSPLAICNLLIRDGYDISPIHPCEFTHFRVRTNHSGAEGTVLAATDLPKGGEWREVDLQRLEVATCEK